MDASDSPPVCAACGDRVGVYEPIWLQHPDGTVVRAGLLEVERQRKSGRIFHSSCLPQTPSAG